MLVGENVVERRIALVLFGELLAPPVELAIELLLAILGRLLLVLDLRVTGERRHRNDGVRDTREPRNRLRVDPQLRTADRHSKPLTGSNGLERLEPGPSASLFPPFGPPSLSHSSFRLAAGC